MWNVMKGPSRSKGKIESSWPRQKDAEKRLKELRTSYRGTSNGGKGRTVCWLEESSGGGIKEPRTGKSPWEHKKKPGGPKYLRSKGKNKIS